MRLTGNLTHPPLIVILGPTATGKTALGVALALALNGEIVSADSRQIYREMDIGTGKPTTEERAQAVHHLIDVVPPDQNVSLAQYQRLAYATIDDIHARGRLPLLVGGTGQYITAAIEGWAPPEVAPNPELRSELERYAAEQGAHALFTRLLDRDPAAEQFIDPRNLRRVIRAIEVIEATGRTFSEQRRQMPPPYRFLQFGLTGERRRLYQRADRRLDAMLGAGFVDEVGALLERGYDRRLPSMSGLGYRQIASHLLDGVPLTDAVEATRNATHDFIRRQLTWFRGHDRGILWLNGDSLDVQSVIAAAAAWFEEGK